MVVHREKILEQIRRGKRSWTLDDVHGGDPELFVSSIVVPLRDLYHEGIISSIGEHPQDNGGRRYVTRIDITVGVDFPDGAPDQSLSDRQ